MPEAFYEGANVTTTDDGLIIDKDGASIVIKTKIITKGDHNAVNITVDFKEDDSQEDNLVAIGTGLIIFSFVQAFLRIIT
jgi:hypothetical protein